MPAITNDKQLRQRLDELDINQQRLAAILLIKNIIYLNADMKIQKAIDIAEDPASSEEELVTAYKQIKSIATESYTDCGSETDWMQQAEHFVASAVMACLTPENQLTVGKSLVWKTAMQARMAKNCEMIEKDSAEVDNESLKQYQIVEQFLKK
ncbi:MAG: hypothetical protein KZQ83_04900 [gamma proteobacterium symbiont of Taylorina sp.]|nr:hypothetical protein [gamma proteobacterium symbiont of Taylorina sp.]